MSRFAPAMQIDEQVKRDNAAFSIEGVPIHEPLAQSPLIWHAVLERPEELVALEQFECQFYGPSASSGFHLEEPLPVHTGGTVTFSFRVCGVVEDIGVVHHYRSPVDPALVRLESERLYSWRKPEEIRRFLRSHSDLIDVLIEAGPHLVKRFGRDLRVALEVVRDPEVGGEGELMAYILTPLSVDEAQCLLDVFDDEWFLDQLERAEDFLNFNLEFV